MKNPVAIPRTDRPCRHYSGILVYASPDQIPECVAQLERLDGVEVHRVDAKTGRIIAVLESERFEEQEQLLRRVQVSPRVLLAELVVYQRDDDDLDEAAPAVDGRQLGRR